MVTLGPAVERSIRTVRGEVTGQNVVLRVIDASLPESLHQVDAVSIEDLGRLDLLKVRPPRNQQLEEVPSA